MSADETKYAADKKVNKGGLVMSKCIHQCERVEEYNGEQCIYCSVFDKWIPLEMCNKYCCEFESEEDRR